MNSIHFKTPYLTDINCVHTPCDFNISEKTGIYKIEFTIHHSIRLKEAVLFNSEHGFSADTAFYGDGYQKLSQYKGTVSHFDTITGYTDKDHYKMPQLKYIQIDDGFQPFMGDWLETSDKFSRPMKDICKDIKKQALNLQSGLRRELKMMKEAGFNFIRATTYPRHPFSHRNVTD